MPYSLVLADLHVDTCNEAFLMEKIDSKLARIENALMMLNSKIDTEYSELKLLNQKMIGMLVMPENFFSTSLKSTGCRQYNEEQARGIERNLVALSALFPKILLVTSIAWEKSGFYKQISLRKSDLQIYYQDKKERGITTGNYEHYLNKIKTNDARLKKAEKIITGPAGARYDYKSTLFQ